MPGKAHSLFLAAILVSSVIFAGTSYAQATPTPTPAKQAPAVKTPAKGDVPASEEETKHPKPECAKIILAYLEAYDKANCKQAYDFLGPLSRKHMPFKEFIAECNPQNKREKNLKRLQVRFNKNTVLSCTYNALENPKALVEIAAPLQIDPVHLQFTYGEDNAASPAKAVSRLEQEIQYADKLLKKDELPQDHYQYSRQIFSFSWEEGVWKLEPPKYYGAKKSSKDINKILDLVKAQKIQEADIELRKKDPNLWPVKTLSNLSNLIKEKYRAEKKNFPVEIKNFKSDIRSNNTTISGQIVNTSKNPITGLMIKVYYLDSENLLDIFEEVLLLSKIKVTFPRIVGEIPAEGQLPFKTKLRSIPENTEEIYVTISGVTQ